MVRASTHPTGMAQSALSDRRVGFHPTIPTVEPKTVGVEPRLRQLEQHPYLCAYYNANNSYCHKNITYDSTAFILRYPS